MLTLLGQLSEKGLSFHDRKESDNRIEVTLLMGIAENNSPHAVRCKKHEIDLCRTAHMAMRKI